MTAPLHVRFIGGFGNQLFQYCHSRARAEREGRELRVEPWLGQQVFALDDPPADPALATWPGYCQCQSDLIYTASWVQQRLHWHPELFAAFDTIHTHDTVAHVRRGDYATSGHVLVSIASYERAWREHGDAYPIYVSEDNALHVDGLPAWLPDFHRLASATTLYRANSTFSWWAAVLGDVPRVFAPVIAGLPPGPQDCVFVAGNHPKMHDTLTDLHLAP